MSIFESVAKKFLDLSQNQGKTIGGLHEVPRSRSTNFLELRDGEGRVETYVIKLPMIGKMEVSVAWVKTLRNEINVQETIRRLGFRAKDFLLVNLDDSDPLQSYAVSSYIPGQTLEELNRGELVVALRSLVDYLYKLHFTTIGTTYGYLNQGQNPVPVGLAETRYLRSDLEHDAITLSVEAERGLRHAVSFMNGFCRFCLCHCDVTLRNVLWDSGEVHLIDWACAKLGHPAHDLAHLLFLLMEHNCTGEAIVQYEKAVGRYEHLGFELNTSIKYYLGQRYIEFGRIRGHKFIERGAWILSQVKSDVPAVRIIEKGVQFV